ncbi:MAG: SOS response-associated peptidase [Flavobacteriales bacterium]|nr:SOS response-associated peptidase [Flavobacteriales bacterium]
MCYTVAYLNKRKVKYAERAGANAEEIRELERQLEDLTAAEPGQYHISGFTHPQLLCFTRKNGPRLDLFRWGLIPPWVKDAAQAAKLSRQTLNARGETIFDKPAFRHAAACQRCLVLVDGFFEFHHVGKVSIPFHIKLRNEEPMALGGLYEHWTDPGGQRITSVSLVTTRANTTMARIHNKPGEAGPRMPFIVPRELDNDWLAPADNDNDKARVEALIRPFPEDELDTYPVPPLLGKRAIGNMPEAVKPHYWPELQTELF